MRIRIRTVMASMLGMLTIACACFANSQSVVSSDVIITGNLVVQGNASYHTQTIAAASIGDTQVAPAAGIQASKLQHAHRPIYAQGSSTNATAATQVIYVVVGSTGTVQVAEAGAVVPATGSDTCTVDIKKNGTTILSAVIALTSSQTARQVVAGAVTSASVVAGDVLEVVVAPNHNTGTLPQGVFVALDVFEAAQ